MCVRVCVLKYIHVHVHKYNTLLTVTINYIPYRHLRYSYKAAVALPTCAVYVYMYSTIYKQLYTHAILSQPLLQHSSLCAHTQETGGFQRKLTHEGLCKATADERRSFRDAHEPTVLLGVVVLLYKSSLRERELLSGTLLTLSRPSPLRPSSLHTTQARTHTT